MRTSFGILLFVLVYAPIVYMVYDELTGRRSPVRSLLARGRRSVGTARRDLSAAGSRARQVVK
jgi:hypothetical protein